MIANCYNLTCICFFAASVEFGKRRPVIGFDINVDQITELAVDHNHAPKVLESRLC
jgi:hypothetical protein